MTRVLLATDADWISDEVTAALADANTELYRVRKGSEVVAACQELAPHLAVIDMQIGNMGGMATCLAIRHEEEMDRLDPMAILLLADRAQDAFLARRAEADGVLVKPVDAFRLRRAASTVLDGNAYTDGLDWFTDHEESDGDTADDAGPVAADA
ncbi:MAG: response regulator transcription factor [Acidimicrobiia bacterium]|nr:response regulator transcription factor [Acidimicrobiia bacterium]